MPKTRPPYPPQLRARLIEIGPQRADAGGAGPAVEPSGQTIRNWLRQPTGMTADATTV
jgi:hypothetical protein